MTSTKNTSGPVATKSSHPHAEDLLVRFGLSEHEALVYMYLLERGSPVGGTKIAYGTGLFRQYVYTALPKLVLAGLVEEIPRGKRKQYLAVAPAELGRIARRKLLEADDVVRELEKFSALGREQDVEVVQGERAIQEYELHRIKSVPPGTIQYFIGGASKKFLEVMGDVYAEEYAPLVNERTIVSKYLGSFEEREPVVSAIRAGATAEFRYLPKLQQGVVNVMIMDDSLSFYTFVNPPVLYVIRSKIVVESYLNLFSVLWDLGKEVT